MPRRSSGPSSTRHATSPTSPACGFILEDNVFKVFGASDITAAAHHEFEFGQFDRATADIGMLARTASAHPRKRNTERAQRCGSTLTL